MLAFDRGSRFRCVVNLSTRAVSLAGHGRLVLTSEAVGEELPPDTAAWLQQD